MSEETKSYKQAVRLLDNLASEIEKDPTRWCQYVDSRDPEGNETTYETIGRAVSWCLVGLLRREDALHARTIGNMVVSSPALLLLAEVIKPFESLSRWNDANDRKAEDAVVLLREAAEIGRSRYR